MAARLVAPRAGVRPATVGSGTPGRGGLAAGLAITALGLLATRTTERTRAAARTGGR
jgi:hypothetical protein